MNDHRITNGRPGRTRAHARRLGALLVAAIAAVLLGVGLSSTATAAPPTQPAVPLPVTGTVAGTADQVAGTFDVQRFVVQNGQLTAVGTFTGQVTDARGNVIGSGTDVPLSAPVDVAASGGSCQILDLVIGPLDLNLLGLVVHLDTVHLNITAQSGSGNLLGNLLCAITHLLDGPSPLQALAALLNRLLGVLG